jgi:hypothetical protein
MEPMNASAHRHVCRKPGRGVVFSSNQHSFGRAMFNFYDIYQLDKQTLILARILQIGRQVTT